MKEPQYVLYNNNYYHSFSAPICQALVYTISHLQNNPANYKSPHFIKEKNKASNG